MQEIQNSRVPTIFQTFSVSEMRERFGENCNLMEAMDTVAKERAEERQKTMKAIGTISFNQR